MILWCDNWAVFTAEAFECERNSSFKRMALVNHWPSLVFFFSPDHNPGFWVRHIGCLEKERLELSFSVFEF